MNFKKTISTRNGPKDIRQNFKQSELRIVRGNCLT